MDKQNIEYRLNFFGYGNPASLLWFVGIEEGGSVDSNEIRMDHPKIPGSNFTHDPELPEESSPVWNSYRKLASALGVDGAYFMSNLAPFARPQMSVGLDFMTGPQYQRLVKNFRVPYLNLLIERFRPRAVVFHGKGAWQQYRVREAFGLPLKNERIQAYPEQRLVFAPFLGQRGCTPSDKEALRTILDPWLKSGRSG
jgi:hypothetical protein